MTSTTGQDDDDRLAARSRRGDPRALATLYRRHAPALVDYLERACGDRGVAEDLLHETFLRLFEGRGRYSGRGRFRAWLFTIATHLLRDRQRRRRRHTALATAAAERMPEPARPPDPLQAVVHRELLERIESELRDLPESYAVAFHLRVREAFAYGDMAAITGEPEGTLRSRVHHTLKRLRLALAPSMNPEAETGHGSAPGADEERR